MNRSVYNQALVLKTLRLAVAGTCICSKMPLSPPANQLPFAQRSVTLFYIAILAIFFPALTTFANQTMAPFTVEGSVSWQGFQASPTNILAVSKTEGKFMFSYSNNLWHVQFFYRTNYCAMLPNSQDLTGTMIDIRNIPDGIREIMNFSSNATAPGIGLKNIDPSAIANTNRFPEWEAQEVFLPWLTLCPRPDLPFIDSTLMRVHFESQVFDNIKNKGRFELNYLEPEGKFLKELAVTNPGALFLVDGSTRDLPYPYKSGYCQFAYKVIGTTNYNGLTFPLSSVLYQFAPSYKPPPERTISSRSKPTNS